MAVLDPGLESGAVAGSENFLPGVGHQHYFAVEDVDEFVFGRMPMPLAGPAAGRQTQEVHPKVREPCRIAQTLASSRCTRCIKGCGIPTAGDSRYGFQINSLAHRHTPRKLIIFSAELRDFSH